MCPLYTVHHIHIRTCVVIVTGLLMFILYICLYHGICSIFCCFSACWFIISFWVLTCSWSSFNKLIWSWGIDFRRTIIRAKRTIPKSPARLRTCLSLLFGSIFKKWLQIIGFFFWSAFRLQVSGISNSAGKHQWHALCFGRPFVLYMKHCPERFRQIGLKVNTYHFKSRSKSTQKHKFAFILFMVEKCL